MATEQYNPAHVAAYLAMPYPFGVFPDYERILTQQGRVEDSAEGWFRWPGGSGGRMLAETERTCFCYCTDGKARPGALGPLYDGPMERYTPFGCSRCGYQPPWLRGVVKASRAPAQAGLERGSLRPPAHPGEAAGIRQVMRGQSPPFPWGGT